MPSAIKHVIVLMLENRSFDHLLAYSGIAGLSGVDTSKVNPDSQGAPVAMTATTPDRAVSDPGHEFEDVDWQIHGAAPGPGPRPIAMNGFANKDWPQAMQCAAPGLVPVLTHLAKQYLVCDNWFSSMPGPTWPNRFFVHAGSAGGLANSPSSLSSMGAVLWSKVGFSFQHGTVFDALTKAGNTWRIYHGDHFPQVCAIDTMPSAFVASPEKFRKNEQFGADMHTGTDVADYTFIEPDYGILSSFKSGDSQHPAGTLSAGERLISTVADAVISSPLWESSLLIILYDEHGGFYDQLPTPTGITPPGDDPCNATKAQNPPQPAFAFDRYGVRVPAVIVSPWVKPGTVSHSLYDHSSVVRTLFRIFGLPGQLTNRDGDAASLDTLIEGELQAAPSVAMPRAPEPPEDPLPEAKPRYVHSLDAFARVAAQIHHALRTYRAAGGLQAHELHAAISPLDDLSGLPGLPLSGDPDETRAYIQTVANEVESHRAAQRLGRTP